MFLGAEAISDAIECREPDVGHEETDNTSICRRNREQVAEHRRCGGVYISGMQVVGIDVPIISAGMGPIAGLLTEVLPAATVVEQMATEAAALPTIR